MQLCICMPKISAELSTLVTTLTPVSNTSSSCKDHILTKTLLIPIFNHLGGIEVRRINDRLVPRQENSTHYYVVSEDSVLSKDTQIFGKSSKVIGRMCTVLDTVNASTIPSLEVLMEAFKLEFTGII